jgi:hypothetical protein
MAGKYYAAYIVQFHNHDNKEQHLSENDLIHIPKKVVNDLLKPYDQRTIYCVDCAGECKRERRVC